MVGTHFRDDIHVTSFAHLTMFQDGNVFDNIRLTAVL